MLLSGLSSGFASKYISKGIKRTTASRSRDKR